MSHVEQPGGDVRVLIPNDADRLIDVVARATAEGMQVVYCGGQMLVCSVIPVGWRRLPVNVRRAQPKPNVPRVGMLVEGPDHGH